MVSLHFFIEYSCSPRQIIFFYRYIIVIAVNRIWLCVSLNIKPSRIVTKCEVINFDFEFIFYKGWLHLIRWLVVALSVFRSFFFILLEYCMIYSLSIANIVVKVASLFPTCSRARTLKHCEVWISLRKGNMPKHVHSVRRKKYRRATIVVSFHKVDNLKLAAYLGQSLVNKIKVHTGLFYCVQN